jgi:spore coat polysaccharide biosynthesis protein SpsF
MTTLAIVQARLGATRLPRKVLADICGRPLLQWLLDRVRSVRAIDAVVVATTTNREDDELERWVLDYGVDCFRGSQDDVLDRFYRCAQARPAELIVRVTADDPLKDPGLIGEAIDVCLENRAVDYCSNSLRPTYPEGLDIEVFRFAALEAAHREAVKPSDREHVTPYIWRSPDRFELKSLEYERDLSGWRWTVDKPADLEFMRAVWTRFREQPLVSFVDVIAWLERNPAVVAINAGTVRNEGYLKSVEREQ